MASPAVAFTGYSHPLSYILPTVACIFSNINGNYKSYDKYAVIRANLSDQTAFEIVNRFYITDSFDFFVPPSRNNPTDMLVCPEQINNVKTIFDFLKIQYEVVEQNLQRKIDLERSINDERQRREGGMQWNSYQRLATIRAWMDSMAETYPKLVRIDTYGESSEKRPMTVMVISTNFAEKKPAIWIDGGIHAREWVSPATVSYIANELITSAIRGDDNYQMINEFEWYINPNMNPDGYEYSHTMDRMWRKTRSGENNSIFASFFGCVGVDPNRNWAYEWGGKGTSTNPCSQTYKGPKAASEPEVYHTQNYIFERKEQFKLFLTFHSYSQMLFTPWGYDDVPLEDKEDLMNIANKAVKVLESKHGTEYQAGSSPELLYAAAGGSEDWARGVANIKFSYCYELRDTGRYGFILPADQIIPTGEETFLAVKSMVEDVQLYYRIGTGPIESNTDEVPVESVTTNSTRF